MAPTPGRQPRFGARRPYEIEGRQGPRARNGPLPGAFRGIAGAAWADWLFMPGLLGIGAALILGIGPRIAAVCARSDQGLIERFADHGE